MNLPGTWPGQPLHKTPGLKQKLGQFFTPADIARFIAGAFNIKTGKAPLRILDPGTGTAVLACALIEKLVKDGFTSQIQLVCYEIDESVLPFTELSLNYLKDWLNRSGIVLNYELRNYDFILDNKYVFTENYNEPFQNEPFQNELFDLIISNPPFFKISKDSPMGQAAAPVIFGLPNIYSIFIFIASSLLKSDGELVFIIPRSFCSGNFFAQFRKKLLERLKLAEIRLLGSGIKIFESSSVLSESVIVRGIKKIESEDCYNLDVSYYGKETDKPDYTYSLQFDIEKNIIPLPSSEKDAAVLKIVNSWTGSLDVFNLKITAGKLLQSRTEKYITDSAADEGFAPVFWIENMKACNTGDFSKEKLFSGKYLKICNDTGEFLIANKNYVLLRRYSTYLQGRIIALAPYFSNFAKQGFIALERQLACIERPQGELTTDEVLGLSAVLGSKLLDDYVRIINGNINPSAEDIGKIPLPPLETIAEIGRIISGMNPAAEY